MNKKKADFRKRLLSVWFGFVRSIKEMFGLTLLLQSGPRPALDLDPFLEQAVLTYSARGALQLDAMRTTLLYYEGYRAIGDYRGAVVALLRAAGDVRFPTQYPSLSLSCVELG